MVFLKPLEKLEFADIERLKVNEICESQILDYKEQLLDDNKLLKHVSAFANTQGGFLVYGVKETGNGGYPEEILGIDTNQINKERIEQVILGNIQPRLNIKIQLVEHEDPTKTVVVIEIPNSHLKPHMNGRDNTFYKRYNFEALPMTEREVNDTYKRRITSYEEVGRYIEELLKYDFWEGADAEPLPITAKIIIIPIMLERLIDTSNVEDFFWLGKLRLTPNNYPSVFKLLWSNNPAPSLNGIKYQRLDREGRVFEGLEIHRNGIVHAISFFGTIKGEKRVFMPYDFCVAILHALDFVRYLYQRYNYFGDIKIVCNLQGIKDSLLRVTDKQIGKFDRYEDSYCQLENVTVVRELSIGLVESEREIIASSIMNEIFNCYGFWNCPFFTDKGKLQEWFVD